MAYNKFRVPDGFDFEDFMEMSNVVRVSYNERSGICIHMENRPRIFCADGFNFSVQASEFHYCSPRENSRDGSSYYAFEVGFPSHGEIDFIPYAENKRHCRQTVYGWVPYSDIEAVIEKHGGIKYYAIHTKEE